MAELKKDTTYYGSYFPTRLYGVQDMNTFLEGVISDGVIVPYVTTVVINFDVQIVIGLAKALGIKSRRFTAETLDFTVDNPDATLDRIDSIFYRVDLATEKRDSLVYRPGTAAASPVAPDPDTSNPTLIKEIRLCNISVGGGVVNLVQGNIDETVQEISTVSLLADLASIAILANKATSDGNGNNIVATYAEKVNYLTYTYNEFDKIGLDNTDFGGNLISSVNVIVTALNTKNPAGSASIRSAVSNSDLSNLVSDINTELGLSETSYRIEVENVRGENTNAPSTNLPNRVIIISNSTGKIYMGTYDSNLSPNLTMRELSYKDDDHIQTYDSFEQLGLVNSDFSPSDWDSNIEGIIDEMISLAPENSSIFSLFFSGSFSSNLLASLNTELGLSGDGFTLKVEVLLRMSTGTSSKIPPIRVTVVENRENISYIGHFDSGAVPNWQGFLKDTAILQAGSVTPGASVTIVEEVIKKTGDMLIGQIELTITSPKLNNSTLCTIPAGFRPLNQIVNAAAATSGITAYVNTSGNLILDEDVSSVPKTIRYSFAYITA